MIDKSKYLDSSQYPGTIQWDGSYDGGDTAAIMGTIIALAPMFARLVLPELPMRNGIPLRHPDIMRWYGQEDRFSRDQLIAVLCGLVSGGHYLPGDVLALKAAHSKKYYLTAWNTKGNGAMDMPTKFPDICGPEVWALWQRILKPWWAKSVLWLLDVQTLIGALQWRFFEPKSNRVTRNHMLVCIITMYYMPTVTSRLACWINDWDDLVNRWAEHCAAVGEYPTADLFRSHINFLYGVSNEV